MIVCLAFTLIAHESLRGPVYYHAIEHLTLGLHVVCPAWISSELLRCGCWHHYLWPSNLMRMETWIRWWCTSHTWCIVILTWHWAILLLHHSLLPLKSLIRTEAIYVWWVKNRCSNIDSDMMTSWILHCCWSGIHQLKVIKLLWIKTWCRGTSLIILCHSLLVLLLLELLLFHSSLIDQCWRLSLTCRVLLLVLRTLF